MRHILAICLLLAIALQCQAQQKPNTLTPKEIADGWILLFDGETTFGWKSHDPVDAELPKVENGVLKLAGHKAVWTRFDMVFSSFELLFEYKLRGTGSMPFLIDKSAKKEIRHGLEEKKEWTQFSVSVKDGHLFWNGRKQSDNPFFANSQAPVSCSFGFLQDRSILEVRNIKLRPLNTESLFNGKDLDGWKVFPKKKSTFAVLEGAINVKDGPGDLQSVGKYKDFILQLECKSNGKHLNSGIFFRCRDGEYQNGYEAQIRNEFTKEATQKYQIEEYDPKTNKLTGKKEMLFTAVDYGTGAIYRRQPARKQMSKDGEWFAMTIVAHGNHFATWVNGVQVTDWTDNRPKSDNARTGCRLEGGHISIQGHDPTTDLSFRNFRITELK